MAEQTFKYDTIVQHYESCLEKHGDTHLGVDWPNLADTHTRHNIMLDLIKDDNLPVTLLDFGCGAGHLFEHILKANKKNIQYAGLDISSKFIELSRIKFPSTDFYCLDILSAGALENLPSFDYIIMNGVFTEKRSLSFDEMLNYFQQMISSIFPKARMGIAFNVMSKQVDWERDDLFHLSFDLLATFLRKNISRHVTFRQDYGLFEYTTYVYRDPKS